MFSTYWNRLPTLVRAIVAGLLLSGLGTIPWQVLFAVNLKTAPKIPWAVPLMAPYIWVYWRFLGGKGWPRNTSDARQARLRARPLSLASWGWSLLTGSLGMGFALILVFGVIGRLIPLPQEQFPGFPGAGTPSILCWLLMTAIVAGVAEEASFRGYMQSMIEDRHGPVIAISVVGLSFGLSHSGLALMPFFFLVSVVYGALACRTGSILPGVVLHSLWDLGMFLFLWRRGTPVPVPSVWQSGPDSRFGMDCLIVLLLGIAAYLCFGRLGRSVCAVRGV